MENFISTCHLERELIYNSQKSIFDLQVTKGFATVNTCTGDIISDFEYVTAGSGLGFVVIALFLLLLLPIFIELWRVGR